MFYLMESDLYLVFGLFSGIKFSCTYSDATCNQFCFTYRITDGGKRTFGICLAVAFASVGPSKFVFQKINYVVYSSEVRCY